MIVIADKNHYFYDTIILYLKEKGYSPYSMSYIAELDDESGDIRGVLGIDMVCKMEPLITDSPIITHKLFHTTIGFCLAKGIDKIEAFVQDKRMAKMEGLLLHVGFKFVEKINRFAKILIKRDAN